MDPYFEEPAKPEYEPSPVPAKKGHGCVFYGCLISAIVAVVGLIAIGVAGYVGYRYLINTVKEWTETDPAPMPAVAMPADQREALHARLKAFGDSVREGKPTEPIVLTADDINAWIDDQPQMKGKAHVDIDGDRVKGKVSIPVQDFFPVAELGNRFLNGTATLRVAIVNGVLDVRADAIEVKGKALPGQFVTSLRANNLAQKANENPKAREVFDKIDRLEVKNGTVIVIPRTPSMTPEDKKSDDAAKTDIERKADAAPKLDDTPKPDDAPKDEPKGDTPKEAPKDDVPKGFAMR